MYSSKYTYIVVLVSNCSKYLRQVGPSEVRRSLQSGEETSRGYFLEVFFTDILKSSKLIANFEPNYLNCTQFRNTTVFTIFYVLCY